MKSLKFSALISFLLGIFSFLWLVLDFAALTDIRHGWEPNFDAEWRVVSLSFIPLTFFHISFYVTMFLLFKFLKKQNSKHAEIY